MSTNLPLLPDAAISSPRQLKKKKPSLHIDLGDDIRSKLEPFAANRGKGLTPVIRYALEKLFEEESIEPEKEVLLGTAVARRFSIPSGYKLRSFYLTLYMLGMKYGEASSKTFWGPTVYLSGMDKSHLTVLNEIDEEWNRDTTNGHQS